MGDIVDSLDRPVFDSSDPQALERRLTRGMKWTVAVATLICIPLAPWRVTLGLFLGGVLSLLNHNWLSSSISSTFSDSKSQPIPKFDAVKYVLRYVVIAGVVFGAYNLNVISLPATIVGLCSIIVPFLIEVVVQFYYAIFHREDQ
jgi:hypothetical protein